MTQVLDAIRIRLHGLNENPTLARELMGPVSALTEEADRLADQMDAFVYAYERYVEAIDRMKGVGS
jgi:hypothetical protein